MASSYETRIKILADIWYNYRDDDDMRQFIEYNDIGLPLAWLISSDIVSSTDRAAKYINDSFQLLLDVLEAEDKEYQDFAQMLKLLDED